MNHQELTTRHRRLTRQLAQHIVRGIPAECLVELYVQLSVIEMQLERGALVAICNRAPVGRC